MEKEEKNRWRIGLGFEFIGSGLMKVCPNDIWIGWLFIVTGILILIYPYLPFVGKKIFKDITLRDIKEFIDDEPLYCIFFVIVFFLIIYFGYSDIKRFQIRKQKEELRKSIPVDNNKQSFGIIGGNNIDVVRSKISNYDIGVNGTGRVRLIESTIDGK